MTPSIYLFAAAALTGALMSGGAAWRVQAWRYDAQLATLRAGHATTLQAIADKTTEASTALRRYENAVAADLAAKDAHYTQEITHEKSNSDRLRACIRAGTCGVRIVATAAAATGARDRPQDAAPGSVGDAGAALDAAVQERVLDLRDAIAADAAALGYLQDYAKVCTQAGDDSENIRPQK